MLDDMSAHDKILTSVRKRDIITRRNNVYRRRPPNKSSFKPLVMIILHIIDVLCIESKRVMSRCSYFQTSKSIEIPKSEITL